jgi:hypothetical protein
MAKKRQPKKKATRKRRPTKSRQSATTITRAEAEELRRDWENAPAEECRRLSAAERFRRMTLLMDWGGQFGWHGPPRTLDSYRNDPWVRLRKLYLEREGKE